MRFRSSLMVLFASLTAVVLVVAQEQDSTPTFEFASDSEPSPFELIETETAQELLGDSSTDEPAESKETAAENPFDATPLLPANPFEANPFEVTLPADDDVAQADDAAETPAADAPASDDAPAADDSAPAADPPAADAPATRTPAPINDVPADDADAPAADAPAADAKADDAPAPNAPADDAPAADAPAADAPADDKPADDAPTTEAPETAAPAATPDPTDPPVPGELPADVPEGATMAPMPGSGIESIAADAKANATTWGGIGGQCGTAPLCNGLPQLAADARARCTNWGTLMNQCGSGCGDAACQECGEGCVTEGCNNGCQSGGLLSGLGLGSNSCSLKGLGGSGYDIEPLTMDGSWMGSHSCFLEELLEGTSDYGQAPPDAEPEYTFRLSDGLCNLASYELGIRCCAGEKAYPDSGWNMPTHMPIIRKPVQYNYYWPQYWYGDPRAKYYSNAPMVYQPTDTTQLGYSYSHVPYWQPNPGMLPAAPIPSNYHNRSCPGTGYGCPPGYGPQGYTRDWYCPHCTSAPGAAPTPVPVPSNNEAMPPAPAPAPAANGDPGVAQRMGVPVYPATMNRTYAPAYGQRPVASPATIRPQQIMRRPTRRIVVPVSQLRQGR